jgi:hypothetical protein
MSTLWETRSDIPLIDRVRIQAEVLVPLIRALRDELGPERVQEIVRRTLAPMFRAAGERFFAEAHRETLGAMGAHADRSSAGNAVAFEVRRNEGGMEADVTSCRYADLFRELGEPELGFLFVCSSDFGIYEAFPGVRLERTQTIMQGGSHCDFRYRFLAQPSGEEETKSERPERPPPAGR